MTLQMRIGLQTHLQKEISQLVANAASKLFIIQLVFILNMISNFKTIQNFVSFFKKSA